MQPTKRSDQIDEHLWVVIELSEGVSEKPKKQAVGGENQSSILFKPRLWADNKHKLEIII